MNRAGLKLADDINGMRGFTLIELMITVAIIGIIAAIALPSYSKYIVRSNRSVAQTEMMDISNREQQYLLANRAYTDSLTALNYAPPSSVSTKYTASVTTGQILNSSCTTATDSTTSPSYVVAMTPISGSSQVSDGTLYLSNTGIKCPSGKW
jgi:type IV pilus assembly protein PilE